MKSPTRYFFILLASGVMLGLSSCASWRPQYYNHTQLVTSDSLHDVRAIELIDGSEIRFDRDGGIYSPAAHLVKGRTDYGRLIVAPVDQIASCMAERSK